jgi:hypothetical protein
MLEELTTSMRTWVWLFLTVASILKLWTADAGVVVQRITLRSGRNRNYQERKRQHGNGQ